MPSLSWGRRERRFGGEYGIAGTRAGFEVGLRSCFKAGVCRRRSALVSESRMNKKTRKSNKKQGRAELVPLAKRSCALATGLTSLRRNSNDKFPRNPITTMFIQLY